jgi:hypothetical protein
LKNARVLRVRVRVRVRVCVLLHLRLRLDLSGSASASGSAAAAASAAGTRPVLWTRELRQRGVGGGGVCVRAAGAEQTRGGGGGRDGARFALVLKVVVVTGRGVGRGSLNKGVYTSVSEKGQVRSWVREQAARETHRLDHRQGLSAAIRCQVLTASSNRSQSCSQRAHPPSGHEPFEPWPKVMVQKCWVREQAETHRLDHRQGSSAAIRCQVLTASSNRSQSCSQRAHPPSPSHDAPGHEPLVTKRKRVREDRFGGVQRTSSERRTD